MAIHVNSLAHSSIGTRSLRYRSVTPKNLRTQKPKNKFVLWFFRFLVFQWSEATAKLPLLVGIWFQILFHRPHRAAFHLSLTVLVHYRSQRVFSLSAQSRLLRAGFHVSRITWVKFQGETNIFYIQDYHLLWLAFPDHFIKCWFFDSPLFL